MQAGNIMRGVIDAVRVAQRNQVFLDVRSFANSVHKNVPLFAQFGIASVPKVGTRCILLALNGDAEALICIAAQSFTADAGLSQGQTQVGTNEAGVKITNNVEINGAGVNVNSSGAANIRGAGLNLSSNGEELGAILVEFFTMLSTASSVPEINTLAADALTKMATFKGA